MNRVTDMVWTHSHDGGWVSRHRYAEDRARRAVLQAWRDGLMTYRDAAAQIAGQGISEPEVAEAHT